MEDERDRQCVQDCVQDDDQGGDEPDAVDSRLPMENPPHGRNFAIGDEEHPTCRKHSHSVY